MLYSSVDRKLQDLATKDQRYSVNAYHFVFEALDYTYVANGKNRRRGAERHLSIAELANGAITYAISEFGPLALVVLQEIGLRSMADIGQAVFNLVECRLLNKQAEDRLSDFSLFEDQYARLRSVEVQFKIP